MSVRGVMKLQLAGAYRKDQSRNKAIGAKLFGHFDRISHSRLNVFARKANECGCDGILSCRFMFRMLDRCATQINRCLDSIHMPLLLSGEL